jgi:hypothetical protein
MGYKKLAISVSFSVAMTAAFSLPVVRAEAQTAQQGARTAQGSPEEPLAQPTRPPKRLRIYPRYQAEPDDVYPRYYPGPNAVRVCNATYVQEFRPSGPVIVPHMTCVWRRG